jgi:hypothetical protein
MGDAQTMGHRDSNFIATPRALWAACVLFALGTACGDEKAGGAESSAPPIFAAADPSKTCPPGYMGWDFATGGSDPLVPNLIQVTAITCEDRDSTRVDDAWEQRARQSVQTGCNGYQSCNAYMPCGKVSVSYTCGESDAVITRSAMQSGGIIGATVGISCFLPVDADAGVIGSASAPEGKACVPKHCPADAYRGPDMQCVPGPKKNAPGMWVFGPPVAIPLQKTSANENAERLIGGTDYLFVSTVYSDHIYDQLFRTPQVPEGRLTFWFADEYVRKDGTGSKVQGFRCTAASADLTQDRLQQGFGVDTHGAPFWVLGWAKPANTASVMARSTISPECIKPEFAQRAKEDAARQAGVALTDFERDYQLDRLRLHTSFDLEGRNLLPDDTAAFAQITDSCYSPNPPGFFYRPHPTDPKRSYIDWLGYYRQREVTAYAFPAQPAVQGGNGVFSDADGGYFNYSLLNCGSGTCNIRQANDFRTGASFGTRSSEMPTRIRMGVKYFHVNDPELTVRKFGNSAPSIDVDVGYYLAGGDNKSNPYAFGGPQGGGLEGFAARKLRADVYMRPDGIKGFDTKYALLIGSVPLKDGPVSGASVAGRIGITPSKVRRFFDQWADKNSFRMFYCLSAKGLSTAADLPQQTELPNVVNTRVTYGAGIDADGQACIEANTVVTVTRDYTRTPNDPASTTPNTEGARDEASGDNNTQGSQGNASEQGCSGNTCSLTQSGDMAASGMFGNTIFDSSTDTSETQDEDGSGNVNIGGDSEIFGFQVLDSPEDQNFKWADGADVGPKGLVFSYSVDWEAIEEAIDEALNGTNVEAEAGRYGGRKGLGIAYGYKARVNVGPIPGEVDVGVSAGVGLELSFQIAFQPDEDYPCMVDGTPATADKCYMLLSDQTTQADARSECAKLGAVLAEPRGEGEMDDLRKLVDANGGSGRFWVGGQQGYEYVGAACAGPDTDTEKQQCARDAKLSYRWLSDDATFATATGFGQISVDTKAKLAVTDLQLISQLPTRESGVAYDTTARRLVLREPSELMTGICEFEPAADTKYLAFTGGIEVGVSAGLFASFCTPSDDLGICLEGGLNFVSVAMGFEMGQETHTITEYNGGGTLKIGGSKTEVPWSLSIMSGQITAVFKLYFFDIPVPIVEWPGFTIADEPLFESYTPVVSREP